MSRRKMKRDVVPWKNPTEFKEVYKCAYSDDLVKNRWAVEKIAVWETRCWPSLPTAVEATVLLVRSKIQDKLYEANKTLCNAQEVEMMYSSAVVRFVNLLVENDQNSKKKKRMSYLAAERNIPPWIVEIRHNCTHGFNPTLSVLRSAYQTIMTYLEDSFWKPESMRIKRIRRTFNERPIVRLVKDYLHKEREVIDGDAEDEQLINERDKVLKKMDIILNKTESKRHFLKILARDVVQLEDISEMVSDECFLNEKSIPHGCFLPHCLQLLYYPLIKLLHVHELVPTFLELLLLSQEHRPKNASQKIVDLLVMYILDLVQAKPYVGEKSTPFILQGAYINKQRLLYSCAKGCSLSGQAVFRRIVEDFKLSGEWIEEVAVMMSIRRGDLLERGRMRDMNSVGVTFSATDLEEDIQEVMEDRNLIPKDNPWALAPLDIDWASIPIGHVFNPVDTTLEEEHRHEKETTSEDEETCGNVYSRYMHIKESDPVVEPEPTIRIFKEVEGEDKEKRRPIIYQKPTKI